MLPPNGGIAEGLSGVSQGSKHPVVGGMDCEA